MTEKTQETTSGLSYKSVQELLSHNFFIPSYQRGYRWTPQQVEDLLQDIDTFTPDNNNGEKSWYCLQPVVVKKRGEAYEVLDGQQRLTTIFLLIHYANEMWIGKQKMPEFQIEYETRKDSFQFLQSQEIKEGETPDSESNIDFYHISKAYYAIHKWVETNKNTFDNNSFQSKLKTYAKVIWYEVGAGQDAIEIFTRINMGKIPLTNAELIKALFLNSSNFEGHADADKIRLRQLEIASEWDSIESKLHNPAFWYFLNNSTKNKPNTRIELLFDIIEKFDGEANPEDPYSTFRFFSKKFKDSNKETIEANWKTVKQTFQTLEEWFNDRELYHKVGYLVTIGSNISFLLSKSKHNSKSAFKKHLDELIAKEVGILGFDTDGLDQKFQEIEYGKGSVRDILLLHNIQTLLNDKKGNSRFPFDRYKKEKWDIEHIHAIASEVTVKPEELKGWLEDNYVERNSSEEKVNEADDKEETDRNTEQKDYTNIISDILNGQPVNEEEIDGIVGYVLGEEDDNRLRNLCLLDSRTNRSYKNDSFKKKRSKLIEVDKDGKFVPVCTRNVFMKYYSKDTETLNLWNESDREAYLEDIKQTLSSFSK